MIVASMAGSMTLKSPVTSTRMSTDASGACTIADSTAPMPIRAYASGGSVCDRPMC